MTVEHLKSMLETEVGKSSFVRGGRWIRPWRGGHGRLWPNRLWPIFRPTLANRGLDRLWPNRLWPILVF